MASRRRTTTPACLPSHFLIFSLSNPLGSTFFRAEQREKKMRIACDVCETASAALICCADEAVLCASCDEEVHAANMLAGKHRRLPLHFDATKLPRCDICQDKSAFIFCLEDRALFCQDCDEAVHMASSISACHHRLLASDVRVGLSSPQNLKPSNSSSSLVSAPKVSAIIMQTPSSGSAPPISSPCATDEYFFQPSESLDKVSSIGFQEFSWRENIGFSAKQVSEEGSFAAAKVPNMFFGNSNNDN